VEQARFSPSLERLAGSGVPPPYSEPARASLLIRGADGKPLRDLASDAPREFASYAEIPALVVSALLYIENRELGTPPDPRTNPAVEWDRLASAGLSFFGERLGLHVAVPGGSTLATQLVKYRHSGGGRTHGVAEKLRQMLGATLRAYRDGADTRGERKQIVVDYLNTMPLAATPAFGEVYGLGEGLRAWYGRDLDAVSSALDPDAPENDRAAAFAEVLSLLCAVRAPSRYLVTDHTALKARVELYARLLAEEKILDPTFARHVAARPLSPRPFDPEPPAEDATGSRKAVEAIRVNLARELGVPGLYDLDRLHADVWSTLDAGLEQESVRLLGRLHDPEFVAEKGLKQERLLDRGDPDDVVYSVLLYERSRDGNLLRVQADDLDAAFDLNEGMKMELGSTAKLRTLAHYLECVVGLRDEMSGLGAHALAARAKAAADPITRWAAQTLAEEPDMELDDFLQAALDRRYSASPYEGFFTGGGLHTFANFEPEDNRRIVTVREATQKSINLAYIRLMRDLVRYHEARLPYDADRVLGDGGDPVRGRMLSEIADAESRHALAKAYLAFRGQGTADVLERLLTGSRQGLSAASHAILFFAWTPKDAATEEALGRFLAAHGESVSPAETARLLKAYGNPRLNLADYAYLLKKDPLEVWTAGRLLASPDLGLEALLSESGEAREVASRWLFLGKNRRAQDLRLKIRIEEDAFERMTVSWRRLGFPFERLVPSYATAIGSSCDRPAALAELMGILVNDGVRLPMLRMQQLRFGEGTPYDTVLEPRAARAERVMQPEVARTIRDVLSSVVEGGTARRVAGAFKLPDGTPVPVGGKTGSGDNRFSTFRRGGGLISSRAINRTATFVFYVGDRYFGVLTAFVPGSEASRYKFTSALPVSVLKLLAPAINARLSEPPADAPGSARPLPPPPSS
jgi:membrane peptidoglycan carboxypeptidase